MDDPERIRWARSLVFAGWMFALGYLTFVVTQIRRATAVSEGSFEDGVWGQRIEQVSFAALPQFVVIVVAATAAALAGLLLVRSVGDTVELSLTTLVRVVGGLCGVVIALGVTGVIGVFFRNPDSVSDLGAVLGRTGGVLIAVGCLRLCALVERDQTPSSPRL